MATTLLALAAALALAGRSERPLDAGWRFAKGDAPGAEAPAFEDGAWASVRVPHTWNVEDATRGGYYRGVGWYRLALDLSPELLKKRLFLRFGAATLKAKVYLNGRLVGEHRGGFAAFCLPISAYAKAGVNELAVRVDSALDPDVAPLSGDFTFYGGLTREVRLLALDDVAVSPLDEGGPGVYLTPHVADGAADVDVRTILLGGDSPTKVAVETTIEDAKGRVVARSAGDAEVAGATEVKGRLHLVKPRLWDGVRDPYLYRARVRVLRDGRVLDEVVQPLGIRAFRVDPEKGFILNGKPYDLHGVDIHQGNLSLGWAATPESQDEDYGLVREMGCTAVRMAHYQHGDHEVQLCDRLGMAVWAELPLVNKLSDTPAFRENAAQQLRELVKQNYNHPSVVVWSLYNEPWIDKVKGKGEWRMTEGLVRLAHGLDPNRLVTGAMNWGPNHWLTWVGDLGSQNHYWGWYNGSADGWASSLDRERVEAKERSFGISEYGAGASAFQHELPPVQPVPASRWHPEEWQAGVHEKVWPVLEARPWLWCKFIWVMFDFPSAGRNEGDRPGINDKGLVTADRKTRKDAFYYYKAQWSSEPFVHLTSQRFDPRPPGPSEFKVYSNLPNVRLTVDGHDLGEMPKVAPGVFVLKDVPISEGDHRIEAHAGKATDRLDFVAKPKVVGR